VRVLARRPKTGPVWAGDFMVRRTIAGANMARARPPLVAALAYLQAPVQGKFLAGTSTATERQLRALATTAGSP
jgi:hypothetical protein